MEKALAHLSHHRYIYGAALVLLIAAIVIMNVNTYETHVIRNLVKTTLFSRREGFQNQEVVTGGMKIADTLTQDHCQKLKEQLDVYEKLKITHKNVPIENLDETITLMKEYFVSYNCE
jgi:hypothetical protein